MRGDRHAEYLQRTQVSAGLLVRLWVCNIVQIVAYHYASGDAVKGGIPPLKDPYRSNLRVVCTHSEFNNPGQHRAVLDCD